MDTLAALKERRRLAQAQQLGSHSTFESPQDGDPAAAQEAAGASSAAAAQEAAGASTTAAAQEDTPQPPPPASKVVRTWAWQCRHCAADCVPVRSESRCLCGHRLKEHAKLPQQGPMSRASRCSAARCGCSEFFFIVAEGSWALKCQCKHKHTDHDAAHASRRCAKPGCTCGRFHSPWVCNCDHPWADHDLLVVERQVKTIEQMMVEASLEVNNHDFIQRGLDNDDAAGS